MPRRASKQLALAGALLALSAFSQACGSCAGGSTPQENVDNSDKPVSTISTRTFKTAAVENKAVYLDGSKGNYPSVRDAAAE